MKNLLLISALLFSFNGWAEQKIEFTEWVYETSGGYWSSPTISTSLEDNDGLLINISASCPGYLGSTLRFNIWVEGYEWEDVESRLLLEVYQQDGFRFFNFGRVKTFDNAGNYQISDDDRTQALFDALYKGVLIFTLDFEIKHQRRRFNGETKNTFRKAYNKLQKSCSIE
jgi:hypothetical protein